MAFCKNCGSKLEAGAKFCPKCGNPSNGKTVAQQPVEENFSAQELSKKMGCWQKFGIGFLVVFCFLGFLADMCGDDNEPKVADEANTTQATEKMVKENVAEQKEVKDVKKEISSAFFEKGYEYSASFRVNRKQGYGLSANYKYNLKIYNDGTTEIVEEIIGDEFPGHPSELYSCKIEKKSESYRDVAATWYVIEFNNDDMYVDDEGYIIVLRVNGNDKTIQEAITSGDCRFGKFSKKKLDSSKKYICKTCGKEYNPEKQAIVSEEYCYEDYPQTCGTCGKTYTINTDGPSACKGACSRCSSRHTSVSIYESVTGRKVY